MLEVQVESPQRQSWYLESARQNCNQVCDTHLLHCTDNSMNEVSSLIQDSEALDAFAEAGVMCEGFTVGQNDGGAPFQSPEGCHKSIPGGSMPVCDATGSNHEHPLCYCEDGGAGAVSLTESVHVSMDVYCSLFCINIILLVLYCSSLCCHLFHFSRILMQHRMQPGPSTRVNYGGRTRISRCQHQ